MSKVSIDDYIKYISIFLVLTTFLYIIFTKIINTINEETQITFISSTPTQESLIVKEDALIRYIDINREATLVCTHLRIDDVLIEKINCND